MKVTSQELSALDQAVTDGTWSPEKKLFRTALALIEDPNNWCRGYMRLNEEVRVVECSKPSYSDYKEYNEMIVSMNVRTETRTRYCSLGAIEKAFDGERYGTHPVVQAVLNALSMAKINWPGGIHEYNDTHTHAEVMAMWRSAGKANGWL